MRILVVEDSELVRRYVRDALVHAGFECVCACSAAEALSIVKNEGDRIGAMVVDVGLPGINGVELGRHIARNYFDIPMVLITGNLGHPALQEGRPHAALILPKPFTVGQLSATIARACADAKR